MPELPEVQTTVDYLKKSVLNRKILDIWTDTPKLIKNKGGLAEIKKELKGRKIIDISRRGKNIIFDLDGPLSMLIHQKMSGHLLTGRWKLESGKWKAVSPKTLNDPMNRFIHAIFFLSGGLEMALSDLRKFAKIAVFKDQKIDEAEEIKKLGPDPLKISASQFAEILKKKKGKIKPALLDQTVFAGIGNIYGDEALWYAGVNPLRKVEELSDTQIKKIYQSVKKVLRIALKKGGTSFDDYRKPDGTMGGYHLIRKAYQREGEKCSRDGAIIRRVKIGGRSSCFCPKHQK
jgi:formamidopyrimidine-DNA glycosylase